MLRASSEAPPEVEVKQLVRRRRCLKQNLVRGASAAAMSLVTASLLWSSSVQAAAYYVGEIGARSLARGGANVVNPGDPSAVWLNPAAITLSTGVQLQLDLNLVGLNSEFTRDCGGVDNGCAVLDTIDRQYRNQDGTANAARGFHIDGGGRVLGATDSASTPVRAAEPGLLGRRDSPGRFDNSTIKNEAGIQPIPRLFATFNTDSIGLDGFAVGAYVFAPSAGDYKFSENGPARYSLIDRDLLEVYYGLTLAYRFGDWIAVGGSLQAVTSGLDQSLRLTADTVGSEDEDYDVQVRIQGTQHLIPSGNIGLWSNPLKAIAGDGVGDLEIGASVQLPRSVQATGPMTLTKFGRRLREDFLETDPPLATINAQDATATAEFVLPPFYRVGAKYTQDNVFGDDAKTFGFNIEADFVYEQWSTYDHVFLTTQGLTFATIGNEPTALPPIVQPKDWQDAWSLRAGTSLAFFDKLFEVHGGGFYETSGIPNETYSVEVVCGDKVGLGTGVSASWQGLRLDVAYSHVFVFDRVVGTESIVTAGNVKVPPPIAAEGELRTRVAMGSYRASYDMLNVGLTVAFDDLFNFGVHAPQTPAAAIEMAPVAVDPAPADLQPAAAPSTETAPVVAPEATSLPAETSLSIMRLPLVRTIR